MPLLNTRAIVQQRVLGHLKRTFLAGGLILFPIVATYWILRFLFQIVDGIFRPPVERLVGQEIPGLGVVALIIIVYLLGIFTANVVGRRAISFSQQTLLHVPLVRTVYGAMKSLMESLFGPAGSEPNRRVVILEYPSAGLWTIGFLTSTTLDDMGRKMAVVYVPTAPTPQTGWVAILPIEKVFETELTVQQAMRLVLSGGVLSPTHIPRKALKS